MSTLLPSEVRAAVFQSNQPLVLRGFVSDWDLCYRSLEEWCCDFGDRKISWRTARKDRVSDEPCWERVCGERQLTFREFLNAANDSEEWMYSDYKNLRERFPSDSEILQKVSWAKFGFPEKSAGDSTLWVGSCGADTPAHQDTYGYNIVAQLYGKKRWIMFPPETGGLRPTRVPYEESSIYSELNFCKPRDLDAFREVSGARVFVLEAGDALLVPHGWWHHVLHVSDVAITLNMWLPHESDGSSRVSEALVRILVAQLCKDLPPETTSLLLNPNEDDLSDTPLAVLFLQLDAVTRTFLDERRKLRRLKRQKTVEETPNSEQATFDLAVFLSRPHVSQIPSLTSEQLVSFMKESVKMNVSFDDDVDCEVLTSKLRLTRAVINAYCQSNVVEMVKKNLFTSLN